MPAAAPARAFDRPSSGARGSLPLRERERRRTAPWDRDWLCRRLVIDHPDGMELHEIADYFGIAPQRVHSIIKTAIEKLRRRERT